MAANANMTADEVFARIRRPPARLTWQGQPLRNQDTPMSTEQDTAMVDPLLQPASPTAHNESRPDDEILSTAQNASLSLDATHADAEKPMVVRGSAVLRPLCSHSGKRKAKVTEHSRYIRCGEGKHCRRAYLKPTPEYGPQDFVLRTADLEHDLRWWLASYAPDKDCPRNMDYIIDDRFTDQHLRNIMLVAVQQLKDLVVEVRHLMQYAAREPYYKRFTGILKDMKEGLQELEAKDIAELPREGLEEELPTLALELDLVTAAKACVERTIVLMKLSLADEGDGTEKECLVRLGFHGEVQKMNLKFRGDGHIARGR